MDTREEAMRFFINFFCLVCRKMYAVKAKKREKDFFCNNVMWWQTNGEKKIAFNDTSNKQKPVPTLWFPLYPHRTFYEGNWRILHAAHRCPICWRRVHAVETEPEGTHRGIIIIICLVPVRRSTKPTILQPREVEKSNHPSNRHILKNESFHRVCFQQLFVAPTCCNGMLMIRKIPRTMFIRAEKFLRHDKGKN